MVVWNMFYFPFHIWIIYIWDVIRNPLTKSIIFQDGYCTTKQLVKISPPIDQRPWGGFTQAKKPTDVLWVWYHNSTSSDWPFHHLWLHFLVDSKCTLRIFLAGKCWKLQKITCICTHFFFIFWWKKTMMAGITSSHQTTGCPSGMKMATGRPPVLFVLSG